MARSAVASLGRRTQSQILWSHGHDVHVTCYQRCCGRPKWSSSTSTRSKCLHLLHSDDRRLFSLASFPSAHSVPVFAPTLPAAVFPLAAQPMSGSVRARRQASPPGRQLQPVPTSQRFPHPRHDHLDADERREAASRGLRPGRKSHATGGLNLSPGEWKLLAVILVVASAVRLFRISQPNSVVYVLSRYSQLLSSFPGSHYPCSALASMKCTSASSLPGISSPLTLSTCTRP